jgi:hypothetical protein
MLHPARPNIAPTLQTKFTLNLSINRFQFVRLAPHADNIAELKYAITVHFYANGLHTN